jgi:hypothetical protein
LKQDGKLDPQTTGLLVGQLKLDTINSRDKMEDQISQMVMTKENTHFASHEKIVAVKGKPNTKKLSPLSIANVSKKFPWLAAIHKEIMEQYFPNKKISVVCLKFLRHDGGGGSTETDRIDVSNEDHPYEYYPKRNQTPPHHDYMCVRIGKDTQIGIRGIIAEYKAGTNNNQQLQGHSSLNVLSSLTSFYTSFLLPLTSFLPPSLPPCIPFLTFLPTVFFPSFLPSLFPYFFPSFIRTKWDADMQHRQRPSASTENSCERE